MKITLKQALVGHRSSKSIPALPLIGVALPVKIIQKAPPVVVVGKQKNNYIQFIKRLRLKCRTVYLDEMHTKFIPWWEIGQLVKIKRLIYRKIGKNTRGRPVYRAEWQVRNAVIKVTEEYWPKFYIQYTEKGPGHYLSKDDEVLGLTL